MTVINNWQVNVTLSSIVNIETGEVRRLGEYQLKLLLVLIDSPDTLLTRSVLTNKVWTNRLVGPNSLPVALNAIRTAIDDTNADIIKTLPKLGYILDSSYMSENTQEPEQLPLPNTAKHHVIVSIDNTTFLIGDRETIIPLVMATARNTNLVFH